MSDHTEADRLAAEPDPWAEVEEANATPLNFQDMDAMAVQMKNLENDYLDKKRISSEAWHKYQEQRDKVLSALRAANKKKYHVEGLGTLSVVTKKKYKLPKDLEAKKQVLDWLGQFGEEVFVDKVTVNHNTFNSFCNQEVEAAESRGEVLDIPGVDEPVAEFEVRLRK